MSTWDYRVIVSGDPYSLYLEIYEVHYDEHGAITYWSTNPASVVGDDVNEIMAVLDRMQRAPTRPHLIRNGNTLTELVIEPV